MRDILLDTAGRIFQDSCAKAALEAAEAGEFPAGLWRTLCENGFQRMALPGSGVELADVFRVLRVAGRHAAPLPLAEAFLANRWLGERGDRLNVVAPRPAAGMGGREVWPDAPWGRAAHRIVGVDPDGNLFAAAVLQAEPGANLAGEPRDRVAVAEIEPLAVDAPAYALLALSRVVLSAGALERVLELGIGYVQERQQFGRPLAKFQAVQHMLAASAAEVGGGRPGGGGRCGSHRRPTFPDGGGCRQGEDGGGGRHRRRNGASGSRRHGLHL